MITATYRKSSIGYSEDIKATVESLGFRKLNQTRELPDTDAVRGMLKKVEFLVAIDGQDWLEQPRARYKIWRKRSNKKHTRGN